MRWHEVRQSVEPIFGGVLHELARFCVKPIFDLAFTCGGGAQSRSVEECDGDDFYSRSQRKFLPLDLLRLDHYTRTNVYVFSDKPKGTDAGLLGLSGRIRRFTAIQWQRCKTRRLFSNFTGSGVLSNEDIWVPGKVLA